jgi:acetyl-CoA acetyltransferase
MREVVGFSMAKEAARQVYESAGIGPEDVDVVELHDCFAHNELISYEALGLCPARGWPCSTIWAWVARVWSPCTNEPEA